MKLNKIFSAVFITLFSFSIFSCNFLNFLPLNIYCSVPDYENFYDQDSIDLIFNFEPDVLFAEEIISLSENESSVEVDYNWNGAKCSIKPKKGWQKGAKYKFRIDGNLRTVCKGSFTTKLQRVFYYGQKNESLKLESCSVAENSVVEKNEKLIFTFSEEIDQYSFIKNFSLTPYTDFKTKFEGKTVSVMPDSKWSLNSTYKWSLSNIKSKSGVLLDKTYEGQFKTEKYETLPVLEKVCKVEIDELNGQLNWKESLSEIELGQLIGFEFSKKVTKESLEDAIKFEPSVKGKVEEISESDGKKFVFRPENGYEIGQVYRLVIDDSVEDSDGFSLFEDSEYVFTCKNDFLEVVSIKLLLTEGDKSVFNKQNENSGSIPEIDMNAKEIDGKKQEIKGEFAIEFSSAIPVSLRKNCVDCISLSIKFPMSIATPVLQRINWSEDGMKINIEYSGFTESDDKSECYYEFTIKGGQKGCRNYKGEYMQKDFSAVFIVK